MRPRPFKLEQFFLPYEFNVPHLLCASDVQPLAQSALLAMADAESLRLWHELHLGYGDAFGHPLLRERIARDYQGLSAADVLVANPQEAIFLFMHAALQPGDHVVVAQPAYQSLFETAHTIGCDISVLPLDPSSEFHLDVDALKNLVKPQTKAIILNTPHNPSGATFSHASMQAAAALADSVGAWFFCDEVYRFLEHDPADLLPPGAVLAEHGVSFSAMSKVYGLAGLRIGWVATRHQSLLRKMQEIKDFTSICNSVPSEILAMMGLSARAPLVSRALAFIHHNVQLWAAFCQRHADLFQWLPPKAGTTALLRYLPGNSDVFAEQLVKQRGILLLPSSVFDLGNDFLRVGLGRNGAQDGIAELERYLDGQS